MVVVLGVMEVLVTDSSSRWVLGLAVVMVVIASLRDVSVVAFNLISVLFVVRFSTILVKSVYKFKDEVLSDLLLHF